MCLSCSVGALGIELANRLLTFLNTLFDECKTERASVGQGLQSAADATRFLQIHGDYTPQERVAFVARNTSINDLLFTLLRTSFKNVRCGVTKENHTAMMWLCILQATASRVVRQASRSSDTAMSLCASDADSSDTNNTFYQDEFSSSDESSDGAPPTHPLIRVP